MWEGFLEVVSTRPRSEGCAREEVGVGVVRRIIVGKESSKQVGQVGQEGQWGSWAGGVRDRVWSAAPEKRLTPGAPRVSLLQPPTAPAARTVAQRQTPCTCPRCGRPHQSWHSRSPPDTRWKKQVVGYTCPGIQCSFYKEPAITCETNAVLQKVTCTKLRLCILPELPGSLPGGHVGDPMLSLPTSTLPQPLSSCVHSRRLHTLSEPQFLCLSNVDCDCIYPYRLL